MCDGTEGPEPQGPEVFWLLRAQRKQRASLAEELCRAGSDDCLGRRFGCINELLKRTFPKARAVVVRDRLSGYRSKPCLSILLVEAISPPDGNRPGTSAIGDSEVHIVKVGLQDTIGKEVTAWNRCRPLGFTHDSIFVPLVKPEISDSDVPLCHQAPLANDAPGPECAKLATRARDKDQGAAVQEPGTVEYPCSLRTLLYEDAFQAIGGGSVRALEDAVLACCRSGEPSLPSIRSVLALIYERLDDLFYAQSWTVIPQPAPAPDSAGPAAPAEAPAPADAGTATPAVGSALAPSRTVKPESAAGTATPAVGASPAPSRSETLARELLCDEQLKLCKALRAWREDSPEADSREDLLRCRRETLGALAREVDTFLEPCDYLRSVIGYSDFVPFMLRGCAHGDVHGRNVLITLVEGEVASPAIFDYENMSPCNLIGLDFVKLETELKVRAYQDLFDVQQPFFVDHIHKFEVELAERTESANNHIAPWHPPGSEPDTPRGRLMSVLLEVRRLAKLHLGTRRSREREWLEEYYFLLACYGLRATLFTTYQRRHMIGAYVSAGVAARRLSRPWQRLSGQIAEMAGRAQALADANDKPPSPPSGGPAAPAIAEPAQPEMGYYARFAFASRWVRSAKTPFVQAGADLLEDLRKRYPHVLEIDEELALAYLELKQDDKAEAVLQGVDNRYSILPEEAYCRWGRLWKDRGQKALPDDAKAASGIAARCFRTALERYQKAYDLRRDYYPGINVATMQLLLGEQGEARATAAAVLASLGRNGTHEDVVWAPATRGEAHTILCEHDEALAAYQSATGSPACLPHDKHSMRRQLQLLLRFMHCANQHPWTPDKLDEVFGPLPNKPKQGAAGGAAPTTLNQ